ncbi:MAG: Fe-S cluster assembly protein SufD [Gammaproteobacteria bacterium]
MNAEVSSIWRDACQRNRDAIPQLAWLADLRDSALGVLTDRGLPDSNQEDWRYTSLADYFQRAAGTAGTLVPDSTPGDQVQLILRDGRALDPTAGDGGLPAGIEMHNLRNLSPELRTRAARLLVSRNSASESPALAALNLALLSDGWYLRSTSTGAETPPPVHLRITGSSTGMAQPRLLVELAPGSRLNLVIEHQGPTGALANVVTQICCGAGSRLELLRIQDLPADGHLTETTHIELGQDATLRATSLDFGGQLVRQDLSVAMSGSGASADIHGAFLVDGRRHIDNHTTVDHRAPDTSSREIFHGLATGHGRGVFNGRIVVQPGAVRTASALNSRNLLLTNTAEIDTKPELEIFTDDVRCSHGATTGQLDANALFYLRSRGLNPEEARQALITAFLHATLALVSPEDLGVRIAARLQTRLAALDGASA